MGKENRKSIRRNVCLSAAILNSDGSIFGICDLRDVSATGAKIITKEATKAPEEFILVLSQNGRVRRQCKVVRRTETTIGVQFIWEKTKRD